jgi:hypothetical protein
LTCAGKASSPLRAKQFVQNKKYTPLNNARFSGMQLNSNKPTAWIYTFRYTVSYALTAEQRIRPNTADFGKSLP